MGTVPPDAKVEVLVVGPPALGPGTEAVEMAVLDDETAGGVGALAADERCTEEQEASDKTASKRIRHLPG